MTFKLDAAGRDLLEMNIAERVRSTLERKVVSDATIAEVADAIDQAVADTFRDSMTVIVDEPGRCVTFQMRGIAPTKPA